jgi:hypothetical protein
MSEPKKEYFGHAVENGKIRFLSVSQVVAYDPSDDNGCPRRWYFRYVKGIKDTSKKSWLDKGTEFAKQLEHYLITGEDILVPELRAGKHFLPKPGSDLEVEKPLGDIVKAVKLRESGASVAEVEKAAGLVANGIPFTGAADVRHRRGEYVDEDGVLKKEVPGIVVCEIIDHKSTKRINDHTSRTGKVYPGYGKNVVQILNHVQTVGYGVHAANIYPDITHVRLGLIYYQTKNSLTAAKRTGLISVDAVRDKWKKKSVSVVSEMEQVATVADSKSVPYNLKACRSYNSDCPYLEICDRPARSVLDILEVKKDEHGSNFEEGEQMSLFDKSTPTLPLPSTLPPPPPLPDDSQRQAIIDAEKERLLAEDAVPPRHPLFGLEGYEVGQSCNGRGFYTNKVGQGFIGVERGHICVKCAAPPKVHGSVNPADPIVVDHIAAADPLPPEVIAGIENPELREKAAAHAAAHAARTEKKVKKSDGSCQSVKQRIVLTTDEVGERKKVCADCGRAVKVKPVKEGEVWVTKMPKHLKVETEETVDIQVTTSDPPSMEIPIQTVQTQLPEIVPPLPFVDSVELPPNPPELKASIPDYHFILPSPTPVSSYLERAKNAGNALEVIANALIAIAEKMQ